MRPSPVQGRSLLSEQIRDGRSRQELHAYANYPRADLSEFLLHSSADLQNSDVDGDVHASTSTTASTSLLQNYAAEYPTGGFQYDHATAADFVGAFVVLD